MKKALIALSLVASLAAGNVMVAQAGGRSGDQLGGLPGSYVSDQALGRAIIRLEVTSTTYGNETDAKAFADFLGIGHGLIYVSGRNWTVATSGLKNSEKDVKPMAAADLVKFFKDNKVQWIGFKNIRAAQSFASEAGLDASDVDTAGKFGGVVRVLINAKNYNS